MADRKLLGENAFFQNAAVHVGSDKAFFISFHNLFFFMEIRLKLVHDNFATVDV